MTTTMAVINSQSAISQTSCSRTALATSWDDKPSPLDYEKFIPWACRQYSPFDVAVTREEAETTKKKVGKDSAKSSNPESIHEASKTLKPNDSIISDDDKVQMKVVYQDDRLIKIKFYNNIYVPDTIFKLILLTIKFHLNLNSVIINKGLNMSSLRDISKILFLSNITELCFDGCRLIDHNYYILLEKESKLSRLSLSRCSLDDKAVQEIAERLKESLPASRTLECLELSSNLLTDASAKYIGLALRSNRCLKYLNLAGNQLTDKGASFIFDSLVVFMVNEEEFKGISRGFIRFKEEYFNINVAEVKNKASSPKFNIVLPIEFHHPFDKTNTFCKGKQILFSKGNNVLSYLNLAYNSLTILSIRKLNKVLQQQIEMERYPTTGLYQVIMDGNSLYKNFEEFSIFQNLLTTMQNKILGNAKKNNKSRYNIQTFQL